MAGRLPSTKLAKPLQRTLAGMRLRSRPHQCIKSLIVYTVNKVFQHHTLLHPPPSPLPPPLPPPPTTTATTYLLFLFLFYNIFLTSFCHIPPLLAFLQITLFSLFSHTNFINLILKKLANSGKSHSICK